MYPVLVDWGPIFLPAWHVLFVIGAIAAYFFFQFARRVHAPDLDGQAFARLYVCAYLGGYFGARFLSILLEQPELDSWGLRLAALWQLGPMTFYGGLLGALTAGVFYAFLSRLPIGRVLDFALPAGFLGLAYGRIGCFLNGDDYGKPVPEHLQDAWWAVTFPNLGDFTPRYPVQLVEAFFAAGLVLGLFYALPWMIRRFGHGSVALTSLLCYASLRFVLEFYRGDPRGEMFSGDLSPSQYISLFFIPICMITLAWRFGRRQGCSNT